MRGRGATAMGVSYVEGKGAPDPFYTGRGFVPTGEKAGDEIVARKAL